VEKGDGQVDRLLPYACEKDMISFKHLFTQSVKKKFTDSHLWYSVISRPTRSNFTRLQRLTCCISLLFCTMIANAMFYRAQDNKANSSGVIQLGPLKFTMTQLYTSVVSTLIVVPVNLIIVTIFRKAKLKHHGIAPMSAARKTGAAHVMKKQFWRRVEADENEIELDDQQLRETPRRGRDCNDRDEYVTQVSTIDVDEPGYGGEAKKKKFNFRKFFHMRNSANEYKRESTEDGRNAKQGRHLPHWAIYIAWALCFISILVPAFFVILYSMQWGKERSDSWLISMFLSFFQSLLVVDPIKVFIITAAITFVMRKVQNDDEADILADSGDPIYNAVVSRDEEYLHNKVTGLSTEDIRDILQARRVKLTALKPVDPQLLEQQRAERKRQIKTNAIFKEFLTYLGFLLIVLFLAYQSRSQNSYYVKKNLEDLLLNDGFSDVNLDKIWAPVLYNFSVYDFVVLYFPVSNLR
jgi:hypothetical protein